MSDNKDLYDVAIVGGGPAGLSVGSELAKEHKVLIIEKNSSLGKTFSSWFSPAIVLDNADENIGKQFVKNGVTRFMTYTFGGAVTKWDAWLFRDYPVQYPYIQESVLDYWVKLTRERNSEIRAGCEYKDYSMSDGIVTVDTNQGKFRSKLLIDASGSNSTIIEKNKINRQGFYWWSVYGYTAKFPKGLGENPGGLGKMRVGDYMMWQTFRDTNINKNTSLQQGRPVMEYEVLDEESCFVFIFYLHTEMVEKEAMKNEFFEIVQTEESAKAFRDVEWQEEKFGWYPSGGVSQEIAKDNLAFIGNAGCWTAPCGWGMSFILNNYTIYAENLSNALKENRLDKDKLDEITSFRVYQKSEILFDKIVTHFLANAPAPMLDRFINLFKDPETQRICETLFTLTITAEEIATIGKRIIREFDLRELIHIFPEEDYLLFLKTVKDAAENSVIDEAHKLLDHFKKHKAKSGLRNGFDFTKET